MKPSSKSDLLAAAGALALGAATGRWLLDSMNTPDPEVTGALAAHADPPPTSAREGGGTATDRLVLVILDGLGERVFDDVARETGLAPFDWRATVDVGSPSLSRPVYHELLTGVPQAVSGIQNNAHSGRARADDLTARVRGEGGTVGFALETVPWLHDLFGRPEDSVVRLGDEPRWNAITDRFDAPPRPPKDRIDAMRRVLDEGPRLTILHFTGIDHAGHHRGATSPEYREAAASAIRAVLALRDSPCPSKALRDAGSTGSPERCRWGDHAVWMIGSDHGHLPEGGHGGPEPDVRRTTWIGLWPSHMPAGGTGARLSPVAIPGVVPATRLAATFAAILNVPPPREALGEPLPLPDRPTNPPLRQRDRRESVDRVLGQATARAHFRVLVRSALALIGLFALAAAALRRPARLGPSVAATDTKADPPWPDPRDTNADPPWPDPRDTPLAAPRGRGKSDGALALLGAVTPVLTACLAFLVLGPGLTLSAIRTHFAFMTRSLAVVTLGAAIAAPLLGRWKTPRMWLIVSSAAPPAAALAITAGSMGRSHIPEPFFLLLPATGLLPWGVLLGVSLAGAISSRLSRRRT